MYKLTPNPGIVYDINRSLYITPDSSEWAEYQEWLKKNTPLPAKTLEERRNDRKDYINSIRDQIILGGFDYKGDNYQSNIQSQIRITNSSASVTASANVPQSFTWRTTDDRYVVVNGQQMVELNTALQNHIASVLTISRQLKEQIDVSAVPELIDWPVSAPASSTEDALGNLAIDVPQAAKKVSTLSAVASSGKYTDLSNKPDLSQFASAAQGAKADAAVQPADMMKAAQLIDIACGSNAEGTGTFTAFSTTPKILPVVTTVANQILLPQIISQTATSVTVRAWRSKGTLVLTAGPFELASLATVRVAVLL